MVLYVGRTLVLVYFYVFNFFKFMCSIGSDASIYINFFSGQGYCRKC